MHADPFLLSKPTYRQSLFILPIISDPHMNFLISGYYGNSRSILIGGRWPGVAANWVLRMEGGGDAVSLCLSECVTACANIPVSVSGKTCYWKLLSQ